MSPRRRWKRFKKFKWDKCNCPKGLKLLIGRDLAVETECGTVYGTLIKVTPTALILRPTLLVGVAPAQVNDSLIIVFCRNICFITVDPLLPNTGDAAE